jgi:hypothetical protein
MHTLRLPWSDNDPIWIFHENLPVNRASGRSLRGAVVRSRWARDAHRIRRGRVGRPYNAPSGDTVHVRFGRQYCQGTEFFTPSAFPIFDIDSFAFTVPAGMRVINIAFHSSQRFCRGLPSVLQVMNSRSATSFRRVLALEQPISTFLAPPTCIRSVRLYWSLGRTGCSITTSGRHRLAAGERPTPGR